MKHSAKLAKPALLLATIIWGLAFVVMKNTIETIPTFYLLATRFLGAFIILGVVCGKRLLLLNRRYILRGMLLGIFLITSYSVQTIGLHFTTPGKNAFLTAVYCVITPFFAWVLAKQKPDRFNVTAAFICIAGIGLVSLNENLTFGAGDLLSVLCGVFFALHIVFTSKFTRESDVLLLTCIQFLFAGFIALGFGAGLETFPSAITPDAAGSLIYLCVFSTAAAMFLQGFGQKHTSASGASLLLSMEAVFGVIFSVIIYGEALSLRLLCGFALIFAAIILSETKLSFLGLNKAGKLDGVNIR